MDERRGALLQPGRWFFGVGGFALLVIGLAVPSFGQGLASDRKEIEAAPELSVLGGPFAPGDAIVVSTGSTPAVVRERLAFEIDAIEVSDFAQRDERATTLRPPAALLPGTHILRITEVMPDGRVLERALFELAVQDTLVQQASLTGSVDVELTRRMADHEIREPPERVQLRGAALLRGQLAGEDWEASANLPVVFDEHAGAVSSGAFERRDWDLGAFLLEGRRGPLGVRVGHFAPNPPSLILEGFHRRGVSAALELEPIASRLTAWSLRAEPIIGFREGIGLRDRDRRVSGVTFEGQPVPIPGGVLDLSATFLRGRSGVGGEGVSFDGLRLVESGTAWSARADALLWGDRFRLRGEYARTRFDPFTAIAGTSERDDAWSVLVGVSPFQDTVLWGEPFRADLDLEFREVGRLFRSVANPAAPVDRHLQDARLALAWSGFAGNFSFARERDNVDGLGFLPRFRTDLFDAQIGWSPIFATPPERLWRRLLGQPYAQLGWSRERLKPVHTPRSDNLLGVRALARSQTVITNDQNAIIASFPGAAFLDPTASFFGTPALVGSDEFLDPFPGLPLLILSDRSFRTSSLVLGSTYDYGSWSLSHSVLRFEDNTRQEPDSRSDLTGLSGNLALGSRGWLSLSVQRQREKFEDLGFQRTTWLGNLNVTANLLPDVLDASLGGSLTRSRNSTSSVDSRMVILSGRLDWHAWQARPNRPGLTVSLFGTWTDLHDSVNRAAAVDTFQVFLQATLQWPVSLQL